MPDLVGIPAGEDVLDSAARWPTLRLQANERAIFHCLTNGGDDRFCATRFHVFGRWEEGNRKVFVCVRILSGGAEACRFCEQGHDSFQSEFALWLWVHTIWHATDNPKPEGEAWTARKIEGRTLFGEKVERPLLLRLKAGREKAWFKQFSAEWTARGDLMLWRYELRRIGEELETDYRLTAVKEEAVTPAILDKEEVKNLPGVPSIFRAGARFAASMAGADGLLGGGDSLDSGGAAEVELPAATMDDTVSGDDDLL